MINKEILHSSLNKVSCFAKRRKYTESERQRILAARRRDSEALNTFVLIGHLDGPNRKRRRV